MSGKYGLRSNETLLGIILVLVGVSLLTDKLVFFNLIWQILLIVWGILLLRERNLIQGLIVLAMGIIFVADTAFGLNLTYKLIGVSSIVLGIRVLFFNLR